MENPREIENFNPLQDEPPQDMPLQSSPLERVLSQIRFAPVPKMDDQAYIADFQDRIRKNYPMFAMEKAGLPFLPPGAIPIGSVGFQVFWRMSSVDGAWKVSLTREFLTLETTAYTTRVDFLERFGAILEAFNATFNNITGTRFGLRYVNRLKGEDLSRLIQLIRPEALGIMHLGTPEVAITDVRYPVREGRLHARWGHLPRMATHDPAIPPSPTPSWILDMDLSLEKLPLDMSRVQNLAAQLSARGYAFFHWMMTEQFRKERKVR